MRDNSIYPNVYLFYQKKDYALKAEFRWILYVGDVGGVAQLVVALSLMPKGIGFDPG